MVYFLQLKDGTTDEYVVRCKCDN